MEKIVALTFDDGPNRGVTPEILAILKKYQVQGTFFVCGANIVRHRDILEQTAKAGHVVGNHTYSHSFRNRLLGTGFAELAQTQALIEEACGPQPKLFRPPWGKAPFWYLTKAKRAGFLVAPYTCIGGDWQTGITTKQIVANITKSLRQQSIILLHDGHNTDEVVNRSATVAALPTIIEHLQNLGYQFVTMPAYWEQVP